MCYFLTKKSEVLSKFKQYKAFVETQTGCKLKKLRVDGGGEFIGDEFREYTLDNGIFLEVTAAYSSSQNGIAEHGNRTVVSEVRSMLHSQDPHLAYYLWPEAVKYTTYL